MAAEAYAEGVLGAAGAWPNDLFNRAFRRFAAFLWMMPRLAALSIAEIIARTSFASGLAAPPEMPFCIRRRRVMTVRLRSERFVVWRARLEADRKSTRLNSSHIPLS